MELFQLVYACTLAKYCNFSKASEWLFITQPSLSQQIQKLEKELGFPLFTRTSRQVSLTYVGQQFLDQAQCVLHEQEKLTRLAEELCGGMRGKINFGSSAMSSPHISEGISTFLETYPQVKLQYVETWDPDLLELVRTGEVDVALLCLPRNFEQGECYCVWPIRDEYICAVVSRTHHFAEQPSVSLKELARERLVFTSPGSGLRILMLDTLQAQQLCPKSTMNIISLEARLSLVKKGAVTFVMSEQFKLYRSNDLAVIPIEPKIYRTFALISVKERSKSFLVRAFVEVTRQGISKRLKDAEDPEQ